MKYGLVRLLTLLSMIAIANVLVFGQATSKIAGIVVDANGALVAGASVTVTNAAGQQFNATTNENGEFDVLSLEEGTYSIKVSAPGFKTTEVKDVKVGVGLTANPKIQLQVGGGTDTIIVTATGEVLQTQETSIGTTVTGRQITELPFVSRNVLDLITNMPGTNTPGRTRTSTINGLPKSSLNITYDGISIADNLLKSSDGYFTIIAPRTDSVDEVQLSNATPGADSNAEGASQIKFVTKSGTNEYHGGTYWYQKNTALDANTYFNNLNHLPKQPIVLNEGGFKVGGPILKDKILFFVNYEQFRNPNSQPRTRTVLDPTAFGGNFTYVDNTGTTRTINVLNVASAGGFASTLDPSVQSMLKQVQSATGSTGALSASGNPITDNYNFLNLIGDFRYFLDQRFDINPTSKWHFENIYHYDKFKGLRQTNFDNLNSRDPIFPGILAGTGSQNSDRYTDSAAARYTISSTMVNEFRFGVQASRTRFFPEVAGTLDEYTTVDGGPYRLSIPLETSPTIAPSNQARNTPTTQMTDTFSWTHGSHSMNFGWTFTNIASYLEATNSFLPTITLALAANDPANNLFTTANFPGASTAQLTQAGQLYALLTGRISSISASAAEQADGTYSNLGNSFTNAHQREMGFFGQDSFRIRPNLTINYGLRWEFLFPSYNPNALLTQPVGDQGSLTGNQVTSITGNTPLYNLQKGNFAPSFGLAWSPNFHFGDKGPSAILKHVFGESGQTVIRGGYAIAYDREGILQIYDSWGDNAGSFLTPTESISNGLLPIGTLLTSNIGGTTPQTSPGSFLVNFAPQTFPISIGQTSTGASTGAFLTSSLNDVAPNLKNGYVQSWSFGIQRELNKDTALEIRYVGNHGTDLWRQWNLNELQGVSNGFINEFNAAVSNLNLCGGTSFGPNCATGAAALPIFTASFGSASSTLFQNASFINALKTGQLGTVVSLLSTGSASFLQNRITAGVPANFFMFNPFVEFGGAFLTTNGADSNYHSLQVELRRRLSKGLLFQASYVWSHSLTNYFASNQGNFSNPALFSDPSLSKGPSPFNIPQTLKFNMIYELPFGPGRKWSFANADVGTKIMNKAIEGWEIAGIGRIQSGTENLLTSGRFTVNGNDSGVVLNGITAQQLQSMVGVYPSQIPCSTPSATCGMVNGQLVTPVVYFLPPNLAQNSACAFGQCPSGTSFSSGAPFIGPPTTAGQFGQFIYLRGPSFWDVDGSIIKKTKINERVNIEMRFEATNLFNHTNFLIGAVTNDVTTNGVGAAAFGQTTNFFNDLTGTNDVGARMIRWVFRVNF